MLAAFGKTALLHTERAGSLTCALTKSASLLYELRHAFVLEAGITPFAANGVPLGAIELWEESSRAVRGVCFPRTALSAHPLPACRRRSPRQRRKRHAADVKEVASVWTL